jgi:hypothetical protein
MKLKRVALIVSVIVCVFTTPALAAQMSVEPVQQEVSQGDNITVNITVYPEDSGVYSASYTLYFDNTLFEATLQVQGPFITQGGASSTIYKNEINNSIGKIIYAEGRTGGAPVGTDVPGVLATITFQAIGDGGVSFIDLSDLDGETLFGLSGSIPTTVNNGTCKIENIIEQTPTSTSALPTATTSIQTPTPIATPTPTATAIQTHTILSEPLSSPPSTIITTSTATASTPPSKEKPEENNNLSGFKAIFAIIGLFMVLILKRKNVIK